MVIVLSKLKSLINSIYPIIVAVLSAALASLLVWNIPIVPIPKDKLFSVNLTVYSIILTIIFKQVIIRPLSYFEKRITKITLKTSTNEIFSDSKNTEISFNCDTAIVYCQLIISGMPEKIRKKSLKIVLPLHVQAQQHEDYRDFYKICNDCDIIIEMKDTFSRGKTQRLENEKVILAFRVSKNANIINNDAEITLEGKNKNVVFDYDITTFLK
ncbi:hypothetical protein V6S63_00130 [Lactococcus lactis]|uniref:hypothetical protein n=1 Tax=Lactococcus lactis TaxID=1358 RepID=UPI001F0D2D90|nr:hypothetical protein [Lactococcus lactis]MCH5423564.1 hypothetical protein [Lactococcus lactis]MCT0030311.1 hypothetical protein [Lactococcus lactis subsp. lactis]MCT0058954.1 hypothetical protein [Lactococcus lactis subsp. lactis]MCT3089207.1 hypothetical protein [Lactococcus lactis]MDM7502780.1 hypothetical protein [Lactococcus lactis]